MKKYGIARGPTDNNIIRRMRFACSITKTTNTHSECVILIALRGQQWLLERATLLRLYAHLIIKLIDSLYMYIQVSQEECAKLRESVP